MTKPETDKPIEGNKKVTRCEICGQVVDVKMFEQEGDTFDNRCFYCMAEDNCSCGN